MPPHIPRKRLRGSPGREESKSGAGAKKAAKPSKPKSTLYDDLDATTTSGSAKISESLFNSLDDDSDSSLSSFSDEDFQDVPLAKRPKVNPDSSEAEDEDEDEGVEFEDVKAPAQADSTVPIVSGDLELTLNKDARLSLTNAFGDKKGPSKLERKVRNATHSLHVLFLLWHNALRNSWLCDPEVQAIMISHLPPKMWHEVERWRHSSGLIKGSPLRELSIRRAKKSTKDTAKESKSRDWGKAAKRLEEGAVDMSHGDPLFRLMQSLASWWKQRFKITAPGLRKWGYMSLERLDRLTKAHKDEYADCNRFGERVANLNDFRQCASKCEGSRDIGAQLFTGLLRGIGLEARMVASLQPLGFGWNRLEDADPEPELAELGLKVLKPANPTAKATVEKTNKTKDTCAANRSRRQPARRSAAAIEISSDEMDELQRECSDSDDEAVVVMQVTPRNLKAPASKFDSDLEYPHYWTEVLSPVANKYLSVDPIVKSIIATNRELTEAFEPRGQKADKARQVMAYVVGYSPDGTAKDVTVRYLKRQVIPGRTKGMRLPIEKVPIYNRHGKVKRHEEFDWFKSAMSGYRRGRKAFPITEIDDDEDSNDLKPAMPRKKEVKEGEETLQYYKQSKEFVLERHLKREEALKRDALPVKRFKNKAKGTKTEEEGVYLRSDILQVKSAETWHKQGRAPLAGEQPLKRVPYRAATTNRRREILEAEAATGQKVLQGLYSYEQTDWIIPPPIRNGVIPKNEYGNIDLFVEHMLPKGAAHVPYRGAVKVCKRLKIDFAEAVVDFEFGHRMAVPVIQGVVIAEEYHDEVMAELEKDEAERRRKEDEKRRKAALRQWRKFIMGLRIVERIRQEYGEVDESVSVFGHSRGPALKPHALGAVETREEDMAGGFLPEGFEEEHEEEQRHTSSFFPVGDDGDDAGDDAGLTIEHH
ncbi:Rad4 family protein [Metarhizium album ARSEF 1941]|uniref:Rad4 family protein n=1 Tax=Metarhizium album (strain ARSEF 1941) TaxID=1081103 RepID=A0A0B2WSU6_METAS|nr:Rad4 family protein [Metarhizium album ARSEF 1941]KHN96689.1 Rad4 family protein [Metarhizium album ARSEF 1941]